MTLFRPVPPPSDSLAASTRLLAEARQAQAHVERTSRKLARAVQTRETDPAHFALRLARHRLAKRRFDSVVARIPRPVRFYLLGLIPVGKTYGIPAYVNAKKALLPWWARWALWPRKARR